MSLTGALRQLYREAARNLRDWNQKSIAQHRVSIGVTCFARRGAQVVIAQAGPSVAFHHSNGQTTAYFADEEHGQPIGAGRPVEPQLQRVDLRPGDRILLISTSSLRVIDDELFAGVMGLPADRILPELYHRLANIRDVTVLLVTDPLREALALPAAAEMARPADEYVIGADLVAHVSRTPLPQGGEGRPGFQASLFINDSSAVESARQRLLDVSAEARLRVMTPHRLAVEEEAPLPLRRVAGDSVLAQLASAREARVATARAQMQAAAGPMPNQVQQGSARVERSGGARGRREESFSRGLRRGPGEPPSPPAHNGGSDAPLAEDMAREYRARTNPAGLDAEGLAGDSMVLRNGGSVVRVRDSMGGRWKGNGSLDRRTITANGTPPAWLVLVVGVGLLIALVAVLTVPGLVREKEGEQYAQLMDGAQELLSRASVEQDRAERRQALAGAQGLLLQASEMGEAGPEVASLLEQVETSLTELDAIVTPAAVEVIADLREFGDLPVTVSKLEIGAEHAYLFDSNAGQVIAVSLASGEKAAIYTEDAGANRKRPATIAVTTAADLGGETLLTISEADRLWAYTASAGLREIAFARPDGMQVTDMTVYNGALYALDANQHAIYRFEPTSDGFSAAPLVVEDDTALAAGRRLLVAGDEYVTSDADGTVHWFTSGASVVLGQSGIDEPLVAPENPQLVAIGEYGFVDSRTNRIVVLQRDGSFVRQYRHADFDALMAFAVRAGQPYVFSGGQLRKVSW